MKKYIGIEEVLDVNDDSIWWYYLHNYNGYEISSPLPYDIVCRYYNKKGELTTEIYHAGRSIIRSMKHFRQYPYGILIKCRNRSNTNDPVYELSNNNNERECVRLSQLVIMARNLPYAVSGYPRHTNYSNPCSRNQRIFVIKKLKSPQLDDTEKFYPKFHIIEDEDELLKKNPNMSPAPSNVRIPIEPMEGNNEYYGRSDIRIDYHGEYY